MNRRTVLSVTLGVVALGVTAPGVATASTDPPDDSGASDDGAVRILLTNDDGWNGGGLPSLREALVDEGFDVVVFAPADDQSGNSARMSFGRPLTITQQEAGVFSVAGSPADAAEVGLSLAYPGELPDLVISGPNPGANIANASIHSGTIGAAVTSANEGVPAIAVSTNGDPAGGEPDYTLTNQFVIDLVHALVADAAGGPLLPDGLAMNVNVPYLAAGEQPGGVVLTSTDRSYLDVDFSAAEVPAIGESVEATGEFVIGPPVAADGDAAAIANGDIAVTLIVGNYDAGSEVAQSDLDSVATVVTGLA